MEWANITSEGTCNLVVITLRSLQAIVQAYGGPLAKYYPSKKVDFFHILSEISQMCQYFFDIKIMSFVNYPYIIDKRSTKLLGFLVEIYKTMFLLKNLIS